MFAPRATAVRVDLPRYPVNFFKDPSYFMSKGQIKREQYSHELDQGARGTFWTTKILKPPKMAIFGRF